MFMKKLMVQLAEVLDVQRLHLPARPKVLELRYRPVEDWSGDDALNITIVVDESTPDIDRIEPDKTRAVKQVITSALFEAEIDRIPYYRFRKPSELKRYPF
jgi:hypothetical protein